MHGATAASVVAAEREHQSPQESGRDHGLAGLVVLAKFHGIPAEPADLAHRFGRGAEPFDEPSLLLAAKHLGLKARIIRQPTDRLDRITLPALSLRADGSHFIVAAVNASSVLIHDPGVARPLVLNREAFAQRYEGRLLVVTSRASVLGELAKFDFSWFVPAIIKYRRLLGEVFIASLFVQLFALLTPVLYQVVMDKVLVHHSLTTLNVICIALLGIVIFEVVLGAMRGYVMAYTTTKIDAELAGRLFRHLLALPLAYFEARRVGDTVARVRELENVRQFLTSQALTSVLDLLFTVVFLLVMWIYSGWLTLIVLVSLPLYAAWSAAISPVLRRRLDEKFARGADNQAFLVETISGVNTVKSAAVEPLLTRTWDQQLAGYVSAGLRVTTLASFGHHGVLLVQKVVTVAILFLGAKLVIEGKLTVGQLIAFNMLAGQVTAPIVRLAQLWQDFQQVGISIDRLGDLLNARAEPGGSQAALPPIRGHIQFKDVTFRYRPDAREVLSGINLTIEPGEVVGIVGPSGSGKSTLTKLVQRLYVPERGQVLVDGFDLALCNPAWLRRQLGIVLQENFLFGRSVRDNIALCDPGADIDAIIRVAKLAGAHDFIVELPEGYDTRLGEHGTGLSGGQRQRVAIARALLSDPRILIFDEATSALDFESEAAIMANMQAICRGRTVLIIAHRLSAVRMANRIVVVAGGQIAECGPHADLLRIHGGHYARMHRHQEGMR